VHAMPDPPATFYGELLAGSGFTPTPGMQIAAWIDGHFCGQGRTLEADGEVVYTVNVFAEGLGHTDCGAPGRKVTFQVDSRLMVPRAAWDNNQLDEVTLIPAVIVYLPLVMRHN
jgi:hypothetical protein